MHYAFPYMLGAALVVSMFIGNLERIRSSPLGRQFAIGCFVALLVLSPLVGYLIVFGSAETIHDLIISMVGRRM